MWKAGVLSLLVVCISFSKADDDHGSDAVSYNAEQFNEHVEETSHFVMFFAPWCGHCKRLAPTWNELAKLYNTKEEPDAIIAKVDCTVETSLCAENDVTGYPTLKFFANGKQDPVRYKGQRDLESLQTFVEEQLGKEEEPEGEEAVPAGPLYELNDDNFAKFVETGNHFIKFFAPWCGHCKRMAPTWEDLAKEFANNENIKISKVDCTVSSQLCSTHEVRGYPTLLFFRDGQKVDKYAGARDLDVFKIYVNKMIGAEEEEEEGEEEKVPEKPTQDDKVGPVELNEKTFKETVAKGVTFVKFYAPWCGHCKKLAPTWEDLAKKFGDEKDVTIAKVDCTVQKEICSEYKVRGYPTLFIFKDGERKDEYNGGRDIGSLSMFVEKFTGTKSEDKEEVKDLVVELNADNFEGAISSGVTFVKFFAPWCGHCKNLAPTWKDLAKQYDDIPSVKIAKVDCTQHKELCQQYKVRGYPTLMVFKNGEKESDYSGGRDLSALSQFLDKFVFTGEMKDEL